MSTTRERPAIDVTERLYTAADVAAMPSELPSGPVSYELDNGRLIAMSPTGNIHGRIEANLTAAFHKVARNGLGKVRCGEVGILLWRNRDRLVGADVAFIANRSLPIKESPEGYLETIPDLVVEVLSKNDTRDYVERKISDYLHVGVEQVWLVNPASRSLTIHRKDAEPKILSESETVTVGDLIPGFELKIADIFAD